MSDHAGRSVRRTTAGGSHLATGPAQRRQPWMGDVAVRFGAAENRRCFGDGGGD